MGRIGGIYDNEQVEYKDGYFYFDSSTFEGNRHAYRVKIEFADTPIVGEIEDLGEILSDGK